MNKIITATENITFKARQIICLEFSTKCLYAEIIQIIERRQTCWSRPILITQQSSILQDLRSSSDLILPLCLFRPCFDTEILPLLTQLQDFSSITNDQTLGFDLNSFIKKIWLTYQDKF